jgi:DNA-binding LacI/PurR family transcriptional regulator
MSGRSTGQPTLEQVAARAGVGRGTASRVVNGSAHVSERSRQAVLTAVEELGYVPNQAARSLVRRRTDTVALVISESEDRVFGEPFFAGVIRGISAAVSGSQRQLVLVLSQIHDASSPLDRFLSRQHFDGVLLLSLHGDDPLPTHLVERNLPLVLGGRPVGSTGLSYVDVGNVDGARQGVEHLADTGRRRIATIAGPQDMVAGQDRLTGYRDVLLTRGLDAGAELVAYGDFSQQSGQQAMRELLDRVPDLDAVFAANDPMAAGALQVLKERGRRVPDQVAVVGFDDAPMAQFTDPPLTSVHQSPEQMGREMVALLLEQVDERAAAGASRVLSTELVRRAST